MRIQLKLRQPAQFRWCAVTLGLALAARVSGAGQLEGSERRAYETRIAQLEQRLERLEATVARLEKAAEGPQIAEPPPVSGKVVEEAIVPAVATPRTRQRFETPPELVPEIGKIGAEVGLLLAGSRNPFKLDAGTFTGGFIDLPLSDRPAWLHGKLSYEIAVGLSQSRTTFATTSNVAQVANLSVLTALNPQGGLANVTAAVTGTGAAPFPVKASTETRLRLLQVIPFAIKYTPTVFDHYRLRPYVVTGFGTYVTIHAQNPGRGSPPGTGLRPDADLSPALAGALGGLFGGKAPFGGPLVAGQISQSEELEARGLPGGHGNIDLGVHTGAGIAYRLTRTLSLGFDFRYNHIAGTHADLKTYGTRIGVHF